MNLHEYQSKYLFEEYGLPVSKGIIIEKPDEAASACSTLGGEAWVVKTQVHAGGRGKAGGVKLIKSPAEAKAFAEHWLGNRLVTYQSGEDGQPVNKILVEPCIDIEKELYLAVVLDRSSQRVVFIATNEGGMDIEQLAQQTPYKILESIIDPLVDAQPYQGRELAFKLGLKGDQVKQFTKIFLGLAKLFHDYDLTLVEINPLVIKKDGSLHCLDAKISTDDNALYRQPMLREMHDSSQDNPREAQAHQFELNYVALEGNIGCLVNGAGLAMATMDIINLHNGKSANFLDVGGSATQKRVTQAFRIILSDHNVKAILVNIFGGIVRCDMIAEGIVNAVREIGITIPVVVRLEGNSAREGSKILLDSGLNIIAATGLTDAALKVVAAAEGK